MKNFFVEKETVEARHRSAKTNLYNNIETLWLQGVITEGVKESLFRELNKISDSSFDFMVDLVGKEIVATEGGDEFIIDITKRPKP